MDKHLLQTSLFVYRYLLVHNYFLVNYDLSPQLWFMIYAIILQSWQYNSYNLHLNQSLHIVTFIFKPLILCLHCKKWQIFQVSVAFRKGLETFCRGQGVIKFSISCHPEVWDIISPETAWFQFLCFNQINWNVSIFP